MNRNDIAKDYPYNPMDLRPGTARGMFRRWRTFGNDATPGKMF